MSSEIHVHLVSSLDRRCFCTCGDPCPLGREGMALRCTKPELENAGFTVLVAEEVAAEKFRLVKR